jgi:hypothetical protein
MTPLLFPTHDLDETDVVSITEIYNQLERDYTAKFDLDFTFETKEWEVFSGYDKTNFGPVLSLQKNGDPFYLNFLQVEYAIFRGRYSSSASMELQTWGRLTLKKDYGHILIRPETFRDKIQEWIHPVELDFEDDKAFSNAFYVLSNDEAKARLNMTPAFRNSIRDIPLTEFIIEIMGNTLLIGNNKVIQLETATAMAAFMEKLASAKH